MNIPRQCAACKRVVTSGLKTVMCCGQPMSGVNVWRDTLVIEAMQKMLDRYSESGHPIIDNLNDLDHLSGVFFWLINAAAVRGVQNEQP